MKKEKFEKKCQELIEHEERLLKEAEELIKPMEEPLTKLGLKTKTLLSWTYFDGKEEGSFQRIQMKDNYLCELTIGIYKFEDDEKDLDLEALTLMKIITCIRRSFFFNIRKFDKIDLGNFFKEFMSIYNQVLTDGYDKTFARY